MKCSTAHREVITLVGDPNDKVKKLSRHNVRPLNHCSVKAEEDEEGSYSYIDELDVSVSSVPLSVPSNPLGTFFQ